MFDIGWQELFVIAAVTLVVVGPKDLPRVLKQVTLYVRKARSIAREFQNGIDEVVREAELDDIRKQIEGGSLDDIGGEIKKSLDLDDDFGDQFRDVKTSIEDAAKAAEPPALDAPAPGPTLDSPDGAEPSAATEPAPAAETAPEPEPAAPKPEPAAGTTTTPEPAAPAEPQPAPSADTEPEPEPARQAAKSPDSASG